MRRTHDEDFGNHHAPGEWWPVSTLFQTALVGYEIELAVSTSAKTRVKT